ncbi:MAG TPA: flavodoxin family protein [Bacillota bacterium]|nr:flavodoxin family protein [Bacillota bacterium]
MKVLLINGSPNVEGCTYTALTEVAGVLEGENIETEIFQIGKKPIIGCTACLWCRKKRIGKCVFDDDPVNIGLEKAKEADGFIFGSPVHFAAASGGITSLLDRMFFAGKSLFAYKPGAAIVSCRRAGSTVALDQLTKYFTINNMPVASSQYWNMVHGSSPEEVQLDKEGMQTMRKLGQNMAWLLKCIEAGKNAGIEIPKEDPRVHTNYIR